MYDQRLVSDAYRISLLCQEHATKDTRTSHFLALGTFTEACVSVVPWILSCTAAREK